MNMNIGNELKARFGKGVGATQSNVKSHLTPLRTIGIALLAIMFLFTATAAADNVVYFDPDPSSAGSGEEITVVLRLTSDSGVANFGTDIHFDLDVVDIIAGAPGDLPTMFGFVHLEPNVVRVGGVSPDWMDLPPGDYVLTTLTLMGNNTGTCGLSHTGNVLGDYAGQPSDPQVWNDGTHETTAGPMPNLNVTAKYETLDPVTDTFTVTYTVENIGGANAAASTTSITDGTATLTDSVGTLAAGATHTNTVGPFDCPCGTTVTVTVCADMDNVVDESDETDNCMTNGCACDPCPLPDLDVTDKHEEWVDQLAGTYNIVYTVTNIGGAGAGTSTTSIAIDGSEVATDSVPALTPGATHTATLGPYTVSGDFDTIEVCADMDDVVAESNEANNCEENQLHTTGLTIYVDPPRTNVTPQDQFDINIKVDPAGLTIYGVEYYLTYNTGILRAESQVKGPFLGTTSETIVVVNEIDRGAGIVSYAETRKGDTGVTDEGISSVIQFTAIGAAGECTPLDLGGVIIVDTSGGQVTAIVVDGEVCLTNNQAPVAAGCTKHLHNNAQKKFECLAQLCSSSTDLDGDDIVYIRWSFGDGEYGTSEGLGECPCKLHSYTSWIWEPFGDPNGDYVPFNATLTVTDNGDVQMEDTTYIDVNVYLAGDANHDGTVNILDVVLIGRTWGDECTGTDCCELLWTGNEMADMADLNNDCVINILDVVIVGTMWNHNAYYPV